MTVLVGPWPGSSAAPPPPLPPESWRLEPEHRPRADSCPAWCHVCPLLRSPDGGYDVMPGCSYGSVYNDLDGCWCERPEKKPETFG